MYSLATILKGAVYTTPLFDIGIGLWEEVIPIDSKTGGEDFFSIDNLTRNAFHSVFFNRCAKRSNLNNFTVKTNMRQTKPPPEQHTITK